MATAAQTEPAPEHTPAHAPDASARRWSSIALVANLVVVAVAVIVAIALLVAALAQG